MTAPRADTAPGPDKAPRANAAPGPDKAPHANAAPGPDKAPRANAPAGPAATPGPDTALSSEGAPRADRALAPGSAATPAGPALSVQGVTVRFGGVEALSGVSLDVAAGELCGVIGPNGAGKTTLFDVVSGLCRPAAGRIELGGTDVTRTSAVRRARLGMRRTFQRQQVFGRLTVLENLLAAMEWRDRRLAADLLGIRTARPERRRRALDVLELCGLADKAGEYAARLPAGPARLVEVARAVVDEPTVLLLDEPTSGLDAAESDRLAGAITRLAPEAAVLLVEHDVTFVTGLCPRLVVLDLGRVLADGATHQVRADPRVRAAYLGERAGGEPT